MQSSSTATTSTTTSEAWLTESQQPSTLQTYPLRLPSYRASYLGRYHPYGRKTAHARHQPVDLMQTVDLRYEPEYPNRPSLALSSVTEEDEAEVVRFNATSHDASTQPPRMEELVAASNESTKSSRLNDIIIDFVLYLRRVFLPRRSPKNT
ncbi:hypothetical protein K474DRAFT_1707966 [Panus rudis PR-1116 ss-1]|nr:hypothetical protein K474DRAFT_1707966 [Panus rudis PR-1116 ss-1]